MAYEKKSDGKGKNDRYSRRESMYLSNKEDKSIILPVGAIITDHQTGFPFFVFDKDVVEDEGKWMEVREAYLSGQFWGRVNDHKGGNKGSGNKGGKGKAWNK